MRYHSVINIQMKNRISRFLKEGLHFPNAKERGVMTVFITLWIFLILYTLQPFGLNFAINTLELTAACTFTGFFICLISLQVIPKVFKKYYSSSGWTNGKFFLLSFEVITMYAIIATTFLSEYFDKVEGVIYYTYFPLYKRFALFYNACLFVGIFPVSIIYFILLKKTTQEKQILAIDTDNTNDTVNINTIELSGNTKDHVKLQAENILYAKVSGNYVDIYYLKDDCVKHKLLRMSLNQLSDSLQDYPSILRCHRAFLVNTSKLVKVRGNLKGYHLELESIPNQIPVSKSYTKIVKEKLTQWDFY